MMKFYCTLPNCKQSFDTERGLFYHENRRSSIHNRNRCYEVEPPSFSSLTLPHSNKRRHDDIPIPYEVSLISENENYKKNRRGIRYIDADILKSMIEKKDNNSNDFDDEDDYSDDNEDEQFDAERKNIDKNGEDQNFENYEEKDIPEIVNSELSQEYNLEYLKYQHNLYSEIYGHNTIDLENIQQFKEK